MVLACQGVFGASVVYMPRKNPPLRFLESLPAAELVARGAVSRALQNRRMFDRICSASAASGAEEERVACSSPRSLVQGLHDRIRTQAATNACASVAVSAQSVCANALDFVARYGRRGVTRGAVEASRDTVAEC